jgi:hypothetical protein
MALWGKIDAANATGTSISVTNGSAAVTGVATAFTTDLNVGDTLIIISGTTTKNRVAAIANTTSLTLADNFTGTTNTALTLSASTVRIQKAPKFVYQDSNAARGKAALEETYFVDETEAQVAANKAIGINGAGWWKIKTYTDAQSVTRYKTELLVAMTVTAAVAGDAPDDTIVADS